MGDFRELNKQTELDHYPLPHLRDWTHKISGCKVFSKCDLQKAFHQIVLDERDRFKTAVKTPWGLFQFRRLAMGMQNSAQAWQRLIDSVIGDMENVYCYLDDLLIFSNTHEEHQQVLEELFKRLSSAGLALSLGKCQFGVQSLDYLGYRVDSSGLTPLKKKTEALRNFPRPNKQKELLGFLGALNYYRASLPYLEDSESFDPSSILPKESEPNSGSSEQIFHQNPPVESESGASSTAARQVSSRSPAQILDPLYKLATCKIQKGRGQTFSDIWDSSKVVQNSFEDAKILLAKAVTLNYPVPSAPLSLSTDASKTHLGATLDQWVDGHWRPLGYWSKSLRPEQQRYSTYLRELLAIKFAVRHFINEINGRRLTIFTDHMPIIGTWNNPDLQMHDNIAMNAINEIGQWCSEIKHKAGRDLVVPDLLSRPFQVPGAYKSEEAPEYIPPQSTLAAIQEVALNIISPSAIAEAQKSSWALPYR